MSSPATHEQLHRILALMVGHLLRELCEGKPSAAMLDVARRVCKDHGIQLTAGQSRAPHEALAVLTAMQSLPFTPADDDDEGGPLQ
jgi:hypothetical protein